MTARGLLERVTHPLVLRRRLPPPFQDLNMYVSSEAGLRYLKPRLTDLDPALLAVVQEFVRPGDVVWDIGANVGLLSLTAAARAGSSGHVVAVEADAWNVGLLRRSARRLPARAARVAVVPAAAADRVGLATFNIAVRNRSTNALDGYGSTQTGGFRETQIVPSVTLDSLAESFPLPDVLKIDVETAEVLVLSAADTVLAARPVVLCEVEAGNALKVRDRLAPWGYRFFDADQPASLRVEVETPPYNLLALPLGARREERGEEGAGGPATPVRARDRY